MARGSKNRTVETGWFRAAVKAITRREADEPEMKTRRRSGETDGDFRKLARKLVTTVTKCAFR